MSKYVTPSRVSPPKNLLFFKLLIINYLKKFLRKPLTIFSDDVKFATEQKYDFVYVILTGAPKGAPTGAPKGAPPKRSTPKFPR
jgi:hypothetical protein